jgi:[protein-PII] uridylyltransferase
VFYVTDLFGAQITSATRQAAIKRALLQLLAGADQAKPARAAALAG